MTISTEGNHLKSCNNNQPLHHEKTAPRPPRPPTDYTPKNWLAIKEGNSTGRDVGRCPVLGISLALILLPLVSSDPPSHSTFSVFSLPARTIGLPGAEILFWERFVLDHELWKRLLLSVPGPLQKRSQLQQWLKVLCCGGFSLLLIGTESEHGTTCFSIWPFPIRTTGKILIARPCESFCV